MDERLELLQELGAADDILQRLSKEVREQQGTLSGKTYRSYDTTKGPPSAEVPALPGGATGPVQVSPEEVLLGLRESTITFGNPQNNLTHLTPRLFDALKIPLNEIWREQMQGSYDFYYMTMPAILNLSHGTKLSTLRCHLDFEPGLPDGIIIQRIFPSSKWKDILSMGGSMQIALDGQLDWQVGLSSAQIQALLPMALPGELEAHVKNSNELKAHIAIADYNWGVGRVDINAAGESGAFCSWDMVHADLRIAQTVDFGIVFKVPKGMRAIVVKGVIAARPARNWLIEGLRAIFAYLSPQLQDELRQDEDSRRPHLVLGDHRDWSLALPR
jgi:hypothetical protein